MFRRLCAVLCKKQVGRDAGDALRGYTWFWHKIIRGLSALLVRPTLVEMASARWGRGLLGGWLGYPLPALHGAHHSPALANREREGEKCQSGLLGHVPYSSQKPKSFLLLTVCSPDSQRAWVKEGLTTGPDTSQIPWRSQSYWEDTAILECLKADPRLSDGLPGTSTGDLQKSGTYKINVFEHVFWRGLSNLLFPLSKTVWPKMTPAPAKESHLCYFFSPGCVVSAQASQWVPRMRRSHSSEESHQLQAVFLNMPEGLPVPRCYSCSAGVFSSGLLGFLEPFSLLKVVPDNSAKTSLQVMCWVQWKISSVNPWPSELNQSQAIRTQPQGSPLGWGCVPPISAGKPKGRGGNVCSSWPRTALHKPAQEPFPLGAWPFPRRSSLCTERAGLQASWCSNITWLRLRMVIQEEKTSPSTESTTGMETWMDGVIHTFLVESAAWMADLISLRVMSYVMQ